MPTISLTSPNPRCIIVAVAALISLAVASFATPALAAPSTTPAVQAAQAGGTPVIKPPVTRRKALTCTVSRRTRACIAKRTTCTTANGTRTCVNATARCRLVGRVKRCRIISITCTRTSTRPNRCKRTSVRRTAVQAFAVLASVAIPRLLSRSTTGAVPAAAVTTLVSSRPGTRAAPAMVPAATSQRPSATGVGAGIGALALASTLMVLMLGRRRPGRD